MRKAIFTWFVTLTLLSACPFNAVPAWIIPPKHGYFGPSVGFKVEGAGTPEIKPLIWFGAGATTRFDVTVMTSMEYLDSLFALNHIMVEGRYGLIDNPAFAVSPLVDLYLPLQPIKPWAISPGVMASLFFNPLFIHANTFTTIPLNGTPAELYTSVASDVIISDWLTAYVEFNSGIVFISDPAWELWMEIWPGVSISPGELLSLNTAVGIPISFDYIVPSAAVYVNF